jgi:hypothetical protein
VSIAPAHQAISRQRGVVEAIAARLNRASRGCYAARMPLIETEEAARRLARAIASDLSLYNEEKITKGLQDDNLFDALNEEIEEGRQLYKSRVAPDLYNRNFYGRAIVDILVKSKKHIKSKAW